MKILFKIILIAGLILFVMSKFSPEIAAFFKQLIEFFVMILGLALFLAYAVFADSAGRKTFGKRDWAMLSKRMDSSKKHRKLSDKTKRRLRKKAIGF
jgi:amino acid permease